MVQYLLKLLEAGLETLDNPISTKAQIISLEFPTLKAEMVYLLKQHKPGLETLDNCQIISLSCVSGLEG